MLSRDGLHGLNLRAVAGRLDSSVGTLYTYFDNKRSMLEALLARTLTPVADSMARTGVWREDLRTTMIEMNRAFSAHPASVDLLRAGIGAERMDPIREHILTLLEEAGLSYEDQDRSKDLLTALAIGEALVAQSQRSREQDLHRRRSLPAGAFPRVRKMAGRQDSVEDGTNFALGVDSLLETIAGLGRQRAEPTSP